MSTLYAITSYRISYTEILPVSPIRLSSHAPFYSQLPFRRIVSQSVTIFFPLSSVLEEVQRWMREGISLFAKQWQAWVESQSPPEPATG